MRSSVVGQLIRKDLVLYWKPIFTATAAAAAALALVLAGGETPVFVGVILFFIALILAGHMLPLMGIANERKKQNLAFLMSLPISSIQYTTAKLISSLILFLIPWLTAVIVGVWIIDTRGIFPPGVLPDALILAFLPLLGFCLITGAVLVGETEGWGIAANVFCNIVYPFFWYFMLKVPALMANVKSPTVVWNSASLTILAWEFALAPLMLGLTYFIQSRKRDFV